MNATPSLLRAALEFPLRPSRIVRALRERGGAFAFAASIALLVSVLAGLRAWLLAGDAGHGLVRLGTSLSGFVVFPAVVLVVGRVLGGRGSWLQIAAVVAGCAVPFLLIDSLWIAALAAMGAGWAQGGEALALVYAERMIQGWAAVVLVLGIAEAQRFSRWRAVANVGLIVVALVALVVAVRTAGG